MYTEGLCIGLYIGICIYVYKGAAKVYVYTYICYGVCVYIYAKVYVYTYICIYWCYADVYAYMYICVYVYTSAMHRAIQKYMEIYIFT